MTIDDLFKRIVRARLPLLACFVLVPLLGVLLLGSRQHPVWVANARVQVFDGAPSSTTEADGSSSRVLALATTPGVVSSALADAHVTRDATDLAEHDISAQRLGESTVVELAVKDTDPAAAAAIVKALADRVATFMNEGSRSHFRSTLAKVDAQIATTNRTRDEVTTSLAAAIDPRVRNTLRARLASLASTSSQLAQQRTSLVVADATRDLVVAIDPNSRDVRAVPSSLLPRSALAVLLGLVLGLAVAVLLETLRPRLADARAVSRLLGVPVLSAQGHEGTQLARMAALAARRQGVGTVVVMPLEQRDDLGRPPAGQDPCRRGRGAGPRLRRAAGAAQGRSRGGRRQDRGPRGCRGRPHQRARVRGRALGQVHRPVGGDPPGRGSGRRPSRRVRGAAAHELRRADHADHGDAMARHRHRRHPAEAGPRRGRLVSATGSAGMLVSAGSRVRVEAGTRSGLARCCRRGRCPSPRPRDPGTAYDVRLVLETQPSSPSSPARVPSPGA